METVAPHAGAWIETWHWRPVPAAVSKSHPTRVRGLKQEDAGRRPVAIASHPTRVRGLKLQRVEVMAIGTTVAPHAGAWIETR